MKKILIKKVTRDDCMKVKYVTDSVIVVVIYPPNLYDLEIIFLIASVFISLQVLREVKVLSSLQHPNIVGYHTAWMEHVQPAVKSKFDLQI